MLKFHANNVQFLKKLLINILAKYSILITLLVQFS